MLGILVGVVGTQILTLPNSFYLNETLVLLLVLCFSSLMGPKLKEMDEVIKMIHLSTIQNQENDHGRTLLVCASVIVT